MAQTTKYRTTALTSKMVGAFSRLKKLLLKFLRVVTYLAINPHILIIVILYAAVTSVATVTEWLSNWLYELADKTPVLFEGLIDSVRGK